VTLNIKSRRSSCSSTGAFVIAIPLITGALGVPTLEAEKEVAVRAALIGGMMFVTGLVALAIALIVSADHRARASVTQANLAIRSSTGAPNSPPPPPVASQPPASPHPTPGKTLTAPAVHMAITKRRGRIRTCPCGRTGSVFGSQASLSGRQTRDQASLHRRGRHTEREVRTRPTKHEALSSTVTPNPIKRVKTEPSLTGWWVRTKM